MSDDKDEQVIRPRPSKISLNLLRKITNLENYSVNEVFELFADAVNADGAINRETFDSVILKLAMDSSRRENNRILTEKEVRLLKDCMSVLFETFDLDGNQSVDFVELTGGLSILCNDSSQEKSAAAFSLYDYNNDGKVTKEEMIRYLTSVFKVLYTSESGVQKKMGGLSARDLAEATADGAFKEYNAEERGYLTFENFQNWHGSSDVRNQVADSASKSMTLGELRKLSGLGNLSVREVVGKFKNICRDQNHITRQQFYSCLRGIAKNVVMSTDDEERLILCLTGLYDLFDRDGDSRVSFSELLSGLLILCKDDKHDKARTSFKLFDLNNDGTISLAEMKTYLTSVFKIVYHTNPDMEVEMECDAETLASRTAENAFVEADLNHDQSLSFEEFQRWYSQQNSGLSNEIDDIVVAASRNVSLAELKRLTSLDQVKPDELMNMLAEHTNERGEIDRESFFECFQKFSGPLNDENSTRLRVVLSGLYDLFDQDGNGTVDFTEITAGLSILTKGNKHVKAASAFQLYDVDENGVISMDEMIEYLHSVFKIVYHSTPGTREEMGMDPLDLAKETAKEAFKRADIDENGVLSYDEFCEWYSNSNGDEDEEEQEQEQDENVVRQLGVLANLYAFEPSDLLEMFANRIDDNGNVSYQVFHDIIQSVSVTRDTPLTEAETDILNEKMKSVYESLDLNGDGQVDFAELAAGMTILCGGSPNDKIETAFALFDYNGDNHISKSEMKRYLHSVFAIVYEADSDARNRMGGADPETLAIATTDDAFASLGKKNGEQLSCAEFRKWCQMGSNGENVQTIIRDAPKKMSLGEVRRLTSLGSMRAQDVFQLFSRRTSDGNITRMNFKKTILELSTLNGTRKLDEKDQDRLRVLISGLYDQFDINHDGTVSIPELMSGITILCGGNIEDKCRTAFSLYDLNGDQVISLDEMTQYLTSVFRVVYHIDNEKGERAGVDAETLATETARDAFDSSDLDDDGNMTFSDFRKWYLSAIDEGNEDETKQEGEEEEEEEVSSSDYSWVSLAEIRRITNLSNFDLNDVMDKFMEHADDEGRMNISEFLGVMLEFASENLSQRDEERLRITLNHLFSIFDTNGDGKIETSDLVTGLSTLVGEGERDDKARICFHLHDANGDGVLDMSEMVQYLYFIYRVVYVAEPGTKERVGGLSEQELAVKTAEKAFTEADTNNDGYLSFEEFKAWYTGGSNFTSTLRKEDDVLMMSLQEVRMLLNIPQNATVESLITHFVDFVGDDDMLTRNDFLKALSRLKDEEEEDKEWTRVSTRLYDLFDVDKNNRVSIIECISGLSTLLQTNTLGKFKSLFRLFDYEESGDITEAEMCRYLAAAYRVLLSTNESETKETPEVLAYKKTQEIFGSAILTDRGTIEFDEFCRLYFMLTTEGLLEKTSKAVEAVPIDDIRHLMHLESHSVSEVMERFQDVTDKNGAISREDFESVLEVLAEEGECEDPELTRIAILYLFNLFDKDQSGYVDSSELRAGLSVICRGEADDKVAAAFALYDINGDGVISAHEMTTYLTSVFLVTYATQPSHVKDLGVHDVKPKDLAHATVTECFDSMNKDLETGYLTYAEFENWYKNQQDEEDNEIETIDELREITGLDVLNVEDVLDIFKGMDEISKPTFMSTLKRILPAPSSPSIDKALSRLFQVFDEDGSQTIDVKELSCGLSVLLGGVASEKAIAAFHIIDSDLDGRVTISELSSYLQSVFRVMELTGSDLRGETCASLAEATAKEAFVFNQVPLNKSLSLIQFRRWYAEEQEEEDERRSSQVKQNMSIETMQEITGLDSFAPETCYVKFMERADEEGNVNRDSFNKIIIELATFGGKKRDDRLLPLLATLYDLFDRDGDNVVSLKEAFAGIVLLCGGDSESRARALFDMYVGS